MADGGCADGRIHHPKSALRATTCRCARLHARVGLSSGLETPVRASTHPTTTILTLYRRQGPSTMCHPPSTSHRASPRRAFISVGAFCQRVFRVCVERVVLFVLRLKCLVKRREALRGRNLPRDSQVEGAPRVHPASGMDLRARGRFLAPVGHPSHASENPSSKPGQGVNVSCFRYIVLVPSLPGCRSRSAASGCLSSVAGAVRRGGWIHLFAVTGRGGRNAAACLPG